MKSLVSFAAAGLAVLAGGSLAQAQHGHGGFGHGGYGHGGYGHGGFGHGHIDYHHGHIDYHGHGYYPGYSGYGSYGYAYPYTYGSYSYPRYYSPSVYSYPPVVSNAVVTPVTPVVPAGDASTSLRPNAIAPYAGPGVTLRLPAAYPGSVFVQVDKRELEIRPGTEVVLKDKGSYRVEFDRGGEFGTFSSDVSEGAYRFAVGDRGWHLLPDATSPANGGLRPNTLPGEPKK